MPDATPPEGRCTRCKQTRPLFAYKPIHDCIELIGRVRLDEAAMHIAGLEDMDDRWCLARIEGRHHQPRLCVRCHDREATDEQEFIDHVLEDA
ncbi:hypothetical protein AB0D99_32055 [Streptomyces sp. NPDC047971]|uniref:hypothetical protein n=1 Tax=Streptomyces sp. NPDC047971 TaxID=3154499 RepID=UPI0033EF710E